MAEKKKKTDEIESETPVDASGEDAVAGAEGRPEA